MQIILIKGKQGTRKTSVFGPAIVQFFERLNLKVRYIDGAQDDAVEFDRAVADDTDVIIVETNLDRFPFEGFEPDYAITCEARD